RPRASLRQPTSAEAVERASDCARLARALGVYLHRLRDGLSVTHMTRHPLATALSALLLSSCGGSPSQPAPRAVALRIYPVVGVFNIGEPFLFSAVRGTGDSADLGTASNVYGRRRTRPWPSSDRMAASVRAVSASRRLPQTWLRIRECWQGGERFSLPLARSPVRYSASRRRRLTGTEADPIAQSTIARL